MLSTHSQHLCLLVSIKHCVTVTATGNRLPHRHHLSVFIYVWLFLLFIYFHCLLLGWISFCSGFQLHVQSYTFLNVQWKDFKKYIKVNHLNKITSRVLNVSLFEVFLLILWGLSWNFTSCWCFGGFLHSWPQYFQNLDHSISITAPRRPTSVGQQQRAPPPGAQLLLMSPPSFWLWTPPVECLLTQQG